MFANANADAGGSAIALPMLSYRRAKQREDTFYFGVNTL